MFTIHLKVSFYRLLHHTDIDPEVEKTKWKFPLIVKRHRNYEIGKFVDNGFSKWLWLIFYLLLCPRELLCPRMIDRFKPLNLDKVELLFLDLSTYVYTFLNMGVILFWDHGSCEVRTLETK